MIRNPKLSWPAWLRLIAFLLFVPGVVELSFAAPAVTILKSEGKSFAAVTGDFLVKFDPGTNHLVITRRDATTALDGLLLTPGGGDPDLPIFSPDHLKSVVCQENKDGVSVNFKGTLAWCRYQMTLLLPGNTPGLVNTRLEIEPTRDTSGALFAGRHSELAVEGQLYEFTQSAYRWTYYFNGMPGAEAYHTVSLNTGAMTDYNQFIYFGDPQTLKATVLYYEDFTSLNPFFIASGTRLRDTVRQPPGSLNRSLMVYMGEPADFGYAVPALKKPLKKGVRLLVANSFLYLQSGAPDIHQSSDYCGRFIAGVAAIYPFLAKPDTQLVDWPRLTEQGFLDLAACEREVKHSVMIPQAILDSCERYADVFDSDRARHFCGDTDALWTNMSREMRLPYGDAWQYLFPLAMASDYALEFDSAAAKKTALDAATDVIRAGHAEKYVFPLRINPDFSKPEGVRYEYDCTGAYVYLMMDYHRLTGDPQYLAEARAAADCLLKMGFEYPYEFTTTALGPVGLLRLYQATGDRRYLDAIAIPMAAILRHAYLFNPAYQEYAGRTIFRLNEAMPGCYANGWEESALIHYLNALLLEGGDQLPADIREMTAELLRWKSISLADSMAPLLPDQSIIYTGIPREWTLPVNHTWHIPLEGFGYLEWDDSGYHNRPGRVSQAPYCFGALPEAALLLFHPLEPKTLLYVETPIRLEKLGAHRFRFKTLAGQQPFRAALQGDAGLMTAATVECQPGGQAGSSLKIPLKRNTSDGRFWFSVDPGKEYQIDFGN